MLLEREMPEEIKITEKFNIIDTLHGEYKIGRREALRM